MLKKETELREVLQRESKMDTEMEITKNKNPWARL
jgi:hypothetical protein